MDNESEHTRWNDPVWVATWPKREALTGAVTPTLLGAIDARPGWRVCDVGCGAGAVSIPAARARSTKMPRIFPPPPSTGFTATEIDGSVGRRAEREFALEHRPIIAPNSPFAALAALKGEPAPARRPRRRRRTAQGRS